MITCALDTFKCNFCKSGTLLPLQWTLADYEYDLQIDTNCSLLQCDCCSILIQHPLPSKQQIKHFYPQNYTNHSASYPKLMSILFNLNDRLEMLWLKKLIKQRMSSSSFSSSSSTSHDQVQAQTCNIRILDIGCANGRFLLYLKKHLNWEVFGTEADIKFVMHLRKDLRGKKRIQLYIGDPENIEFNSQKFDIIRMNDTIEHLRDPHASLNKLHSLLSPHGIIVGQTPNTDSFDFKIFKTYWGNLHMPRHIHLFNKKNLKQLLQQIAFKNIEILDTIHPGGAALGMQNLLRNFCNIKLSQGKAAIYPLLLVGLLPLSVFQKLVKKPGIIRFVANKQ
ncbi:MAG: class I SAM-dependent methyltransferase [Oligoflexia bacterium]|nr:class I SAM-dependent methyltransferase [Oligoflexia bacterium]